MDEVVCQICTKEYQDNDFAACSKVLNCGHTFCSSCIRQVLGTSKLCPKCRASLTYENVHSYYTNFSLLGILDSFKNNLAVKANEQRDIESLRTKYEELDEICSKSVEELKSNLTLIHSQHDMIKSGLKVIEELMNNERKDVGQTLNRLSSQLEDIRGSNILRKCNFRKSYSLSVSDFFDPNDFLLEIYKRIRAGEQFCGVTTVDDDEKYSRLSVRDENLLLGAFGPSENGPHIKTVKFQDIKNSLRCGSYFPFLEIGCNDRGIQKMMLIKTTNSSLLPRFLKLCTGEEGHSYAGARFIRGVDLLHFNQYGQRCVAAESTVFIDKFCGQRSESVDGLYHDHLTRLDDTSTHNRNDLVVVGSVNGNFNIYQVVSDNYAVNNVIGTIERPYNLISVIEHGESRKVIESGIAINLV